MIIVKEKGMILDYYTGETCICSECAKKYGINTEQLTDEPLPMTCGVLGCSNRAEYIYYVDSANVSR